VVSLIELEVLVTVTEGFCQRGDIPEQVYYDLLSNQIDLQQTLQSDPDYYQCSEMRNKALAVNQQIVMCLNQRISQLKQGKST
jgi:hypothetical protein